MKNVQCSDYPWTERAVQRQYATLLDQIVPRTDATATIEWVRLAEEFAEALQNGMLAEEVIRMVNGGQFEGSRIPTVML